MDPADLFAQIWKIFQTRQPVAVHNLYAGLPITCPGQITLVSAETVGLSVPPQQAACIQLEKRTYLKSDLLDSVLRAVPLEVSVRGGQVLLHRLTPVNIPLSRQAGARISPDRQVTVKIHAADLDEVGSMADLSASGLGMFTFRTFIERKSAFRRNDPVQITFTLPDFHTPLTLAGTVVNQLEAGKNKAVRLGIRIQPDEENAPLIDHYIERRKVEILAELETLTARLAHLTF